MARFFGEWNYTLRPGDPPCVVTIGVPDQMECCDLTVAAMAREGRKPSNLEIASMVLEHSVKEVAGVEVPDGDGWRLVRWPEERELALQMIRSAPEYPAMLAEFSQRLRGRAEGNLPGPSA